MPSQMPEPLGTLPLPLLLQKNPILCMVENRSSLLEPIFAYTALLRMQHPLTPHYMFAILSLRFIRITPFLHVPYCIDLNDKCR